MTHYHAAAAAKLSCSLQRGKILLLQGFIVDEIEQCTSGPLQADEKYDNVDMALGAGMFAWHHEAAQIAETLRSNKPKTQADDSAFWKTLAADSTPLGDPAPSSFGGEHSKVLQYLELINHCHYDVAKVATMSRAQELETFSNESVFVDVWFRAAYQRRFCSTTGGRMGLVPNAALQGDLIAIIRGADVPLVLRTTERGMYELIGECYIHGIMQGEALQGRDVQVQDLCLQ